MMPRSPSEVAVEAPALAASPSQAHPDPALVRRSAAKLWSEGRVNPVWLPVGTWVGCFSTEDRVTWRTEDGTWVAQLQRSPNGVHVSLVVWHHGRYLGRQDGSGWHAATGRNRPRTPRPLQRALPLPLAS
jgi:hypothetical protein